MENKKYVSAEKYKQLEKKTVSLMQNASIIVERNTLRQDLGKTFDGDRDVYKELGYSTNIKNSDYANKYYRQDIARKIVNIFPEYTWKDMPLIRDTETPEATEFEDGVNSLFKDFRVMHYFTRADKLTGLGRFGVLLIGANDGRRLSEPLTDATELLYLQPYSEEETQIKTWNTNTGSKRYMLPEMYTIMPNNENSDNMTTPVGAMQVHYSRILHFADNPLQSDIYGEPRLRSIYNRLDDIEKIVGSSAEAFWRNVFAGMAFTAPPEADLSQTKAQLEEQIELYVHSMQRFMKLQGIEVKELKPQFGDPEAPFNIQIQLISASTGIPQRILFGSEQAQLASSQDKRNFMDRVQQRRDDFATPTVLRPFIDLMIEIGILSSPKDKEYTVTWQKEKLLSDKEQAEITRIMTESIARYASTMGIEEVFPVEHFLDKVLNLTPAQVKSIMDDIAKIEHIIVEEDREEGGVAGTGFKRIGKSDRKPDTDLSEL